MIRTSVFENHQNLSLNFNDAASVGSRFRPKDFQSRHLQDVTRKRKLRYRIHILSGNSGRRNKEFIQKFNAPSMPLATSVLLASGKKRRPAARCPPPSACEYVAGCGGHAAGGGWWGQGRSSCFPRPNHRFFSLENLKQNYITELRIPILPNK